MPRLCESYPGICLTAEEKARRNFSRDSRRVPVNVNISVNNSCEQLKKKKTATSVNPLNAELNPICHLLALLDAHHIRHVSRANYSSICFGRRLGLYFLRMSVKSAGV